MNKTTTTKWAEEQEKEDLQQRAHQRSKPKAGLPLMCFPLAAPVRIAALTGFRHRWVAHQNS